MRKHAPSNFSADKGRAFESSPQDGQGDSRQRHRVKFRSNNSNSRPNRFQQTQHSHQTQHSQQSRNYNHQPRFESKSRDTPDKQPESSEQEEFKHVSSSHSFMAPRPVKSVKPPPANMRVSSNPYALMDSDDEDHDHDHEEVETTSEKAPVIEKNTSSESSTSIPAFDPLHILEPFKEKREYPIEPIEGLLLLGLLNVPPLTQEVRTLFAKYTDKCKQIHQQYMEQYRKGGKRPPNRGQPYRNGHGHNNTANGGHPRGRKKKQELTGEDFAMIRDFKKTEISRDEEGVAKTKAKIRASLNKLTDKTYEKMNTQIHEEMKEMIESGASTEDYHELSHFVFDVASSNRFYGKLYADLFANMVKEYDFLKVSMNYQLKEFLNTMTTVEVASPEDYDRFCEVNKQNEKRRALSSFMGHLLRIDCIEGDLIGNMIHELVSKSIEWIRITEGEQVQNRVCVEEVAEVVFAFLETAGIQATDLNMWEPILSKCIAITEMKRASDNALTSKAKFKYMDVLDMIKKWQV